MLSNRPARRLNGPFSRAAAAVQVEVRVAFLIEGVKEFPAWFKKPGFRVTGTDRERSCPMDDFSGWV
jgi:hypothetical protein